MSKNGTSFSDSSPNLSSFMNAFASAQKRWMEQLSTQDTVSAVPSVFSEAASQWQSALGDTMESFSGETEPIVKETLERMASGQSVLLQVYQMALEAWQEAAQAVQEGEDVQAAMTTYAERVDEQIRKSTTSWSQLAQDQQAMWQRFVDSMQGTGVPMGMLLSVPKVSRSDDGTAHTPVEAMFQSLHRLFEFETLAERLLDVPALGLSREFNEEVAQTFKAFQESQRASVRYQTVLNSIWSDTLRQFAQALGTRAQEGEPVETLRDVSTLWTKVADKTFIRAFRTEDYIEAQNDYLESSLRLRQQQQTLAETFQEALDQPTRSEMDEIYQLLNRLRRQNKMLKRDLAAVSNGAASGDDAALRDEVGALQQEVADLKAALHAQVDEAAAPVSGTSDKEAVPEEDAHEEDTHDDLTAIKGIGSATQEQLYDAGLTTYARLADASHDAICDALGADISADRLAAWQNAARKRAA